MLTNGKHDLAEVSFFLLDRGENNKVTSVKQGRVFNNRWLKAV